MAGALDILHREHDAILRMLDTTEEVAQLLLEGKPVAPEILTGLLEFFQLFADRCHHSKEEDLLFPLLERKGVPRSGGPIGVMLYEHELRRSLIREMTGAADGYGSGASESGRGWAEAARGYTALLRHHIDKENNVLFRAAERLLSEAEQSELARAFEEVEERKMGPGTHERLHALMARLVAQIEQLRHPEGALANTSPWYW